MKTPDFRALCAELTEHFTRWYAVVMASGITRGSFAATKELLARSTRALEQLDD